jgi:hypothetical protein
MIKKELSNVVEHLGKVTPVSSLSFASKSMLDVKNSVTRGDSGGRC